MENFIHSIKKEIDNLKFSLSWMNQNSEWWVGKIVELQNRLKYLEQLMFEFESGQLTFAELYDHATQERRIERCFA